MKKIRQSSFYTKSVNAFLICRHKTWRITGHFAEKARYWQLTHHQRAWELEINFGWISLWNRTSRIFGPSLQSIRLKQHQAKETGTQFVIQRLQCFTPNCKIPNARHKTWWGTMNSSWTKCKRNANKFSKSIKRVSHKTTS